MAHGGGGVVTGVSVAVLDVVATDKLAVVVVMFVSLTDVVVVVVGVVVVYVVDVDDVLGNSSIWSGGCPSREKTLAALLHPEPSCTLSGKSKPRDVATNPSEDLMVVPTTLVALITLKYVAPGSKDASKTADKRPLSTDVNGTTSGTSGVVPRPSS